MTRITAAAGQTLARRGLDPQTLTQQELRGLDTNQDTRVTANEAHDAVKRVDTNGDDRLSPQEATTLRKDAAKA
ncbi:MAG: hypothetical protein AB2A00_12285, partial [Myxococcota bacterium]